MYQAKSCALQVLHEKWVMLVGMQVLLRSMLLSCPFNECPTHWGYVGAC